MYRLVTVGKRTSTQFTKSTSTRTINGVSTTNSEEHLKNDSNRFTIDNSDPSAAPNSMKARFFKLMLNKIVYIKWYILCYLSFRNKIKI